MNLRRALTTRLGISAILVLQVIPLLLFPAQSFSPDTQEWWLPALLVVMVVVADVELIVRRGERPWPWYLISFAQGFNLISRLMMMWSHATLPGEGATPMNVPYVVLTLISMAFSVLMLSYTEWPEVRAGLLRPLATK